MHPVDRIFQAAGQASRLVQLRDMVKEAMNTVEPRCGLCQGWMTSTCPREGRDAKGRRTGPNCNASTCHLFEIKPWTVDLFKERAAKAVDFAKQHDLPIPSALVRNL